MRAIEFETRVKDGNIEIPEEFRDQLHGPVRVTVLLEQKPAQPDMLEQLWINPIKVENFKPLTREEIYEGR